MKSLADIKRRLASVKQTKQITGAMETISVAKMRKALERYESNSVYFDVLFGVIRDIANSDDVDVKEFLKAPQIDKKLAIVVASDKGLCGAFNHDVLKLADAVVDENTIVMPIGSFACAHFEREGAQIDDRFVGITSPDYSTIKELAKVVLEEYGKTVGAVKLVYMRMMSKSTWEAQAIDILPLSADSIQNDKVKSEGVSFVKTEFEPSRLAVLEQALPLCVSGIIYGALVNSAAAEHAARHAAMSASSKNADDMIDALSIEYNSARQSAVTSQLIDIVGSAQAIGEI